jgi:hypothetical protein
MIVRSAIHGNVGGAVIAGGSLTIVGTTITDNTAGIECFWNEVLLANSTISGNVSPEDGGGVRAYGAQITVVNSTISGNVAQIGGGGVALRQGTTLDLVNSIIAGNTAPANPDVQGPIGLKLASIVGVPAGLNLADILDPAGLADNGGPTQTIALTDSPRNPAIGKGDAATCAADPIGGVDQRGEPRTPPCDIGAYEVQP